MIDEENIPKYIITFFIIFVFTLLLINAITGGEMIDIEKIIEGLFKISDVTK